MKPLIDADIFLYEIGFSSESSETIDGVKIVTPASFNFAEELLDKRIKLICMETEATEPPALFITNTPRINAYLNKERARVDEAPVDYVDNFRIALAEQKEYKGGRKAEKPYHFYNLLYYMLASYDVRVNEQGLEADDYMCITQYGQLHTKDTIICSRDKDVRQCPGWHYSWEMGTQASIGPIWVEPLGHLENSAVGKFDAKGKAKPFKIFGTGHKFFYAQLLMGDNVDNIGGVKKKGQVFAYNLLKDAATERECYELVSEVYRKEYPEDWKIKIKEQADLLYMIREFNDDGSPKMWLPPARD